MKYSKTLLLSLLLCLLFPVTFAQKKSVYLVKNDTVLPVKREDGIPRKSRSSEKIKSYFPAHIHQKQAKGYLSYSIDTIIENESRFFIHVFEGECFNLRSIRIAPRENLWMQQARLSSYIKDGMLSIADYPVVAEKIIAHYENNGFPFTQVFLDSLNLKEDQIDATLIIEQNQFIIFDSIILKGTAKLSYSYLYPYLGLRKNRPYNERIIQKIPQRMSELLYVTQVMPAGIEFVNEKAYLYLYLDKQRVNQFDGFIALVPVSEQTGKIAISGELKLALKNIFTLGESLNLEWKSPHRHSQYLNVRATFPYLFRTPFGVDGSFILDKTDTSYLNMNYLIGLQYSFAGNNYFKTYFDFTSSQTLSKELLSASSGDLTHADYGKNLYGIELMIRKLDYIYNPRKGFSIVVNGAAGKTTIKKSHIPDPEIYEGIDLERVRYRLLGDVKGYIPIWKNFILHLSGEVGAIFGKDNLESEIFKIGGFNSLRGFDENSIFASNYTIGLAEVRYLFNKNSYIHLFYNMAWYERKGITSYTRDLPWGFGAGIAFQTKAGIFSLVYALGKQFENPISLKTGKIHFGIALNF